MTHEVTITINSVNYLFHANMVKRSLKNRLIQVQKPLTKANQDGTKEPETLIVDIKRITDVLTVNGEIRAQTISSVSRNSIEAFNLMATAFKKHGGCTILYRGVSYSGSLDQLESEENANIVQGYVNSAGARVSDIPQKVKCTISFIIGTVR